MHFNITSDSSDYTKKIGNFFSKVVSAGDIIVFSGELGGGKTTFITGIAEGLGIRENIASPSFTIINLYNISGRNKLVHVDFYRLESSKEIFDIGLENYIYDNTSIICIEWGGKFKKYLFKDFLEVTLNYVIENKGMEEPTKRLIGFESSNSYWDKKLEKFKRVLRIK